MALLLWGLITHGTYAGTGDEPHYLSIAHSIAFDFDLDLSNNYGVAEPLIAGGTLRADEHTSVGRWGIQRPVHDIGLPIVAAPFVILSSQLTGLLGRWPSILDTARMSASTLHRKLISMLMIALTSFMTWQMALLAHRVVRRDDAPVAFSAILIALSPPLLILGTLFFTEVLTGAVLLAIARLLTSDAIRWYTAAAGGVATGFLVFIHMRNAGIVVALAAVGLWRTRQLSFAPSASFLATLAAVLLARIGLNWLLWGTALTTPHARVGTWNGLEELIDVATVRSAGLMFDQEYGLLVYAPVYALVAFGALPVYRASSAYFWTAFAVICCYYGSILLPELNVHGWTGGWSPPGRFLAPILPLLTPFLALALIAAPRAVVVVVISAQIAVSAYFWQNPKNAWNDGDGIAAVCSRGGLSVCRYPPSFVGHSDQVRPYQSN